MIKISEQPLHVQEAIDQVSHSEAGAVDVFIGTVRNRTKDKSVVRLEFEAYEAMALKEMQKIATLIKEKWPVLAIAIHHRIGVLDIGEIPVVIAVSSPHRRDAFEACKFAIDTLKETVPIWKKEIFEDGEVWVAAHP
ncbi:molybdenum cofactor biosynthesis protein MoaE [Fulvivirgaceae bacterium BMA10]|uniref:Molybdopterin synthase catalytic subunit n=1 Tax=Splendidivirga corallicola TaxID=3051826 RepID=A0ABT8KXN6_9BACT|nr:molybdenum cofactor biosynthesis protein MoaE [Fulvivirgaceae bacterium BMA10]